MRLPPPTLTGMRTPPSTRRLPVLRTAPPCTATQAVPEAIPLDVVYEDEQLIVVDKVRGGGR